MNDQYGAFYELTNRFDFDDEASIPTWLSQFIFLLISGVALLLAYIEKQKSTKAIWYSVAVVALLGSLDEVATLHENILQSLHIFFIAESTPKILANAWVLIIPFLLLAIGVFILKAVRILPRKTLQKLVVALSLYFTGAIIIDILTSSLVASNGFFRQGVMVAIEEMLELSGQILALYALGDYADSKFGHKLRRAKNELLK